MDRSVRQCVDPVRRGVHGPGVSDFGTQDERSNSHGTFAIFYDFIGYNSLP